MATNEPYTLQDVQDRINTLVNNDTDTPATTDDEWGVVLNLIYQAIGNWEGQDVMWRELYKTYSHASNIADSTTIYSISATDFKAPPTGFLRLTLNGVTTFIPFVSVEESQRFNAESRTAWLTGNNKDGWTLNLGWTPATGDDTVGASIAFDYYKMADRPSDTATKFEMSDPNYIVYFVTAQKALLESQNNKFSVYSTMAADCMDRMRVMNELSANFNSNQLEDIDYIDSNASFGE